jgi:hypothetical protein
VGVVELMRVNLEVRASGYCDSMSAIVERAVTVSMGAGKPPVPREHGAWGILLVPFATAVGVSGVWNLPVTLLLVSILCFYVARTSWLKKNHWWTVVLLAGSVACGLPLLLVWKLWWLVVFGAVVAPLAFRKTERSVAMQLLAVAGLTLTAPAAWYTATGELGWPAWRLWLLNVLYFAGGVLYVKMHIAAASARRADKLRQGAATMIYHGALTGIAALGWPAGLAYLPAIVRAFAGVARLSPVLGIKRLGWTEVAYSIVFAVSLVALAR